MSRQRFVQNARRFEQLQDTVLQCLTKGQYGSLWEIDSMQLLDSQHEDEIFLRIHLRLDLPREGCLDEVQGVEETEDLSLPHTCLQLASVEPYEGYLDWVFNDVYQIPAPYLKVWKKSTGEMVQGEVLQAWIEQWRQVPNNDTAAVIQEDEDFVADHRVYRPGTLILETHPVLFRESFHTLHLCEVVNTLQLIVDDVGQRTGDVLLLCLSRLGSFVGLKLGPLQYQHLMQMMTEIVNI